MVRHRSSSTSGQAEVTTSFDLARARPAAFPKGKRREGWVFHSVRNLQFEAHMAPPSQSSPKVLSMLPSPQ
jgi:hypothetical protein